MITYKDLRIAINRQLNKTGIPVMSKDVQEGFDRPSFFVDFDNVYRDSTETQVERSLTVRIYFFPSNRDDYSIEVLEMQDTLESLFDLKLKVKNRLLNIQEFNSFVNDGVLQCSFDLEFFDGRIGEKEFIDEEFREEHPIEVMEELKINKELK